jgi:hypothetical protein
MKEFLQTLQEAFPPLAHHPVLMARILLLLLVVGTVYGAKSLRKRICMPLSSRLFAQIFITSRWLYVYQTSLTVNDWQYYTSETTGGKHGDDIIWTLVRWPSMRRKDSFRISEAVGMLEAIDKSQAILLGRWHIVHDPDSQPIGTLPARGLVSKLRCAAAKGLYILAMI